MEKRFAKFILGVFAALGKWNERELKLLRQVPWLRMMGTPLAIMLIGAHMPWESAWRTTVMMAGLAWFWFMVVRFICKKVKFLAIVAVEIPFVAEWLKAFGLLDEVTGKNAAGQVRQPSSAIDLAEGFVVRFILRILMWVSCIALTVVWMPVYEFPGESWAIGVGFTLVLLWCLVYNSRPILWKRYLISVALLTVANGVIKIALAVIGPSNADMRRFVNSFGYDPSMDSIVYGFWWVENWRVLLTSALVLTGLALLMKYMRRRGVASRSANPPGSAAASRPAAKRGETDGSKSFAELAGFLAGVALLWVTVMAITGRTVMPWSNEPASGSHFLLMVVTGALICWLFAWLGKTWAAWGVFGWLFSLTLFGGAAASIIIYGNPTVKAACKAAGICL